jgi:hypothetical protein
MSRSYTSPPPSAFVACSGTASTVFTRIIFALLANFSIKTGGGCENYARYFWKTFRDDFQVRLGIRYPIYKLETFQRYNRGLTF